MDGGRRHFDDIDGAGGPPVGDLVAFDGGRSGGRRGSGGGRRRRSGGSRIGGGGAGATGPSGGAPGSALPLASGDLGRGLLLGLVTVVAAAAVALVAILAAQHDVVEALLTDDPFATLREFAAPIVIAGAAFEAVLALGLVVTLRANPFVVLRGITGQELFRGFLTFLLALVAWQFAVRAIDGPFAGGHWWPAAVGWLFVLEVVLGVVVAPILEERLFRGLLLAGLRPRFGPVVAVLLQAAIYGLAHVWALRDASRPATVVGMIAVGAVFGWMANATEDLRPVVVGHAMFGAWVMAERVLRF
jgi:membrane protease YdiL (CAAX protease family)